MHPSAVDGDPPIAFARYAAGQHADPAGRAVVVGGQQPSQLKSNSRSPLTRKNQSSRRSAASASAPAVPAEQFDRRVDRHAADRTADRRRGRAGPVAAEQRG